MTSPFDLRRGKENSAATITTATDDIREEEEDIYAVD
jgi:hypothetical protein